jgi:glycine cleavage system aminomethyltransferase T
MKLQRLDYGVPQAEAALGNFIDPNEITLENFPFVTAKNLTLSLSGGKKIEVWAARISYVGEKWLGDLFK